MCLCIGAPADHVVVSGQLIHFERGDTHQTHIIIIKDDELCEIYPCDFFTSNITLVSGVPPIDVIRPQATVIIDDTPEPECCKLNIMDK